MTPNDPKFNCQWGLYNWGAQGGTIGVDIQAKSAWDVTTGTGVTVAIADTGVDTANTDLAPNLVGGYNFLNSSTDVTDTNGHGTFVAGVVGAKGNNSAGIAGLDWGVRIIPLKISESPINGASVDIASQAVLYAISHGARIINASFRGPYSQTLDSAIQQANSAGILLVAAAGNGSLQITSSNASNWFPCTSSQSNVLCVTATDRTDNLGNFTVTDPGPVPSGCPAQPTCPPPCANPGSNWSSTYVDLAAPGKEITSTFLGNSYATLSGTSASTANVSGAAALLLSYSTNLTVTQLKNALLNTVDLVPALAGKAATNGRVNAFAALQSLEGLPHAYSGDMRTTSPARTSPAGPGTQITRARASTWISTTAARRSEPSPRISFGRTSSPPGSAMGIISFPSRRSRHRSTTERRIRSR
jgi:subtilisin family serine protease